MAEEKKFIGQPPLNVSANQYSSYCHDAAWTLAYALNNTLNSEQALSKVIANYSLDLTGLKDDAVNEEIAQAFNITPPFKLEDFTYNNNKFLEIIFRHLEDTSFDGVTVGVAENK